MTWTIDDADNGRWCVRREIAWDDEGIDITPVSEHADENVALAEVNTLYHLLSVGTITEQAAGAPAGANAPYKIERRGGKYVVLNNTGAVKATFDSRPKALAYLRALYANVKGAAKRAGKVGFTGKAKDRVAAEKAAAGPMYLMVKGDKKYPIKTAQDAVDAWKLRNNGKGVSEAQVLAHIRRACKALGLPLPAQMRGGS